MDFRTRCARGSGIVDDVGKPLAPPVVSASTFAFADQAAVDAYYQTGRGWVYSRYENPTVRAAERFLADLEGAGEAALFSSGMAAIATTVLTLARAGQTVVAQREVYGGTHHLFRTVLPDAGIGVEWLGLEELAALEPSGLRNRALLYLETPTNPTVRLVDLERASEVARGAGVPVIVDGTFASPALQRPLELGCDLVLHSATKYLGGHADLTAGAVAGRPELVERIARRRRVLGGTAGAFTAFLLQRGMRTLAVRVEAQERGAAVVAESLRSHPRVTRVLWPGLREHPDHDLARRQMRGFGSMVTFEVEGGDTAARRVHDRLELFTRAASLGGVESLVSIPARMSHRDLDPAERERAGVTPGMLRLSVGLESPPDLAADLERALS